MGQRQTEDPWMSPLAPTPSHVRVPHAAQRELGWRFSPRPDRSLYLLSPQDLPRLVPPLLCWSPLAHLGPLPTAPSCRHHSHRTVSICSPFCPVCTPGTP